MDAAIALVAIILMLTGLAIWNVVAQLRRRLDATEARLERLERRSPAGPISATGAAPMSAPFASPDGPPARTVAVTPTPAPPTAVEPVVAPSPARAAEPIVVQPIPSPDQSPPAPAGAAAAEADTTDGWEVVVGASWLNKIGAAVFVIGIALLVGYSMTNLGPVGRVAIGYAMSLSLLAAGVALERREPYRLYAHGLMGGGWAGTYFTTYAMRNVPAAQLVTSDVLATALLTAVAAGMIWHSLRFRSKTVTSLAYVIAFITLGLTPLTGFSLVAALPLAASLLVVSQRFGWTDVSALGVASTYAVFALRSQVYPDAVVDPAAWPPYLLLAAYWITFETADVLARRRPDAPQSASLFSLNAVGFMTAGLLHVPDRPDAFAAFAALSSAAYLASAIVRARLTGRVDGPPDAASAATTAHAATALAAGLAVLAIELRFDGMREIVALLLVTELLFVSGLTLGDRLIRHMGAAAAAFATFRLLALAETGWPEVAAGPWTLQTWTFPAVLVAAAWYVHREWLRSRAHTLEPLELGYTWAATWLALLVFARELQPIDAGLAGLMLTVALVEAGLRRGAEYRYEAYVTGLLSAAWLTILVRFDGDALAGLRQWTVLPAAALMAYGLARRLAAAASSPDVRTAAAAAAMAAAIGTLFVALFEAHVLPPALVGPALALTGLGLAALALWRGMPVFRWHAYALFLAGGIRAFNPVVDIGQATGAELAGLVAAVACTYAGTLLARRGIGAVGSTREWTRELETILRPALSVFATLLLTSAIALEARSDLLTLLWGVEGVALLVAGFPSRERVLRLSGLAILFLCIGRLFLVDLGEQEALVRIASFVALGVFLLGVSWVYARYRERISRFL
jgi:hypothetical protein